MSDQISRLLFELSNLQHNYSILQSENESLKYMLSQTYSTPIDNQKIQEIYEKTQRKLEQKYTLQIQESKQMWDHKFFTQETQIKKLQSEIYKLKNEKENLEENYKSLENRMQTVFNQQGKEFEKNVKDQYELYSEKLISKLKLADETIEKLKDDNERLFQKAEENKGKYEQLYIKIEDNKSEFKNTLYILEEELTICQQKIKELYEENRKKQNKIEQMEVLLSQKEKEIFLKEQTFNKDQKTIIAEKNELIYQFNEKNNIKESKINELTQENLHLNSEITNMQNYYEDLIKKMKFNLEKDVNQTILNQKKYVTPEKRLDNNQENFNYNSKFISKYT